MTTAPRWRLTVHGPASLQPPDAGATALALVRKDAAWLACAVLDGPCPSQRVAAMLWPDAGARGAANNLRQRLHRLRKTSGARLIEMADMLAPAADLQCDLPDLHALAANPGATPGLLLQDQDFDAEPEFAAWLAQRRELEQAAWRDALAGQAAAAQDASRLVLALDCAQRLLQLERLSEHAHRRLMRLHYLRGDRAAALAAFEACERALKDELGVAPGAETLALLQTIEHAPQPTAATQPVPAQWLRPPRTVGRDGPAQALSSAHADGAVPVLVAEAGLGKSRLLQDFAATQPQALYTQARPSDATVPYGTLARLLHGVLARGAAAPAAARPLLACLLPELADTAPPPAPGSAALQAAVRTLLGAPGAPPTLIVDDLHFADRASLELLRRLIEDDADTGVPALRWVLAQRPADGSDEHAALLQSLSELPAARWIVLAPLDEAAQRELLDTLGLDETGIAALLPALLRHAGGNPLYLLETLRELGAAPRPGAELPRPAGITRLLDRRLQRLSREALALARLAAVAVPDFSIELAEQALQAPALALADAWRELELADVLCGEGFAHDLVHDAVQRATPTVVAARAHRQVAAFLERADAEPARVALHWRAGGDAAAAAAAFERAAQRAEHASRPLEQARLLLDAAEQWDAAGATDRALLRRADAVEPLIVADGLPQALEISTRMVETPAAPAVAGRLWTVHATALVWAGRSADAEAAALQAQPLLAAQPWPARAQAELALGMAIANQGRMGRGLEVLRPLWLQVDELPDPGQRIDVCGAYSIVLAQLHRNGEGLAVAQRQLQYARDKASRTAELNALLSIAFFALRRGDLDTGIAAGEQARRLGQADRELASLASMNDVVLGDAYIAAGRYGEGIQLLEAAIAHAEDKLANSNSLALARTSLANAFVQLGRPELAQRLLATAPAGASIDNEIHRHALLAQILEQRGDAGAHDAWQRTAALAGPRSSAPALLAQLALARAEGGAAALARVAAVLQQAETTEQGAVVAAAMVARVMLEPGHEDSAAHANDAARQALRQRSSRVYLPGLLLACDQALQALGREADARRWRQEAWAWVQAAAANGLAREFQPGFLQRNPVNAQLRRLARPA